MALKIIRHAPKKRSHTYLKLSYGVAGRVYLTAIRMDSTRTPRAQTLLEIRPTDPRTSLPNTAPYRIQLHEGVASDLGFETDLAGRIVIR